MITLFQKHYSEEELCDIERDVYEAISPTFNPKAKDVDFSRGTFLIRIEWEPPCD